MQTWSKLTTSQASAIRAIAATGEAGLPLEVNGRKTINGNCEWALQGHISHSREVRPALIEKKDHGYLRTAKNRWGMTWPVHDIRYHLTAEGQVLAETLGVGPSHG